MSAKTEYYAKVASDASRDLTRSVQNWTGFLTTVGRLYRYSFPDQLMIYAQRPDATACAEYDLWNDTMRRYVKRGAKGIGLFDRSGDQPRIRYVFDVSDTGERRNSRPVRLWTIREGYEGPVRDAFAEACDVQKEDTLVGTDRTTGTGTRTGSSASLMGACSRIMMKMVSGKSSLMRLSRASRTQPPSGAVMMRMRFLSQRISKGSLTSTQGRQQMRSARRSAMSPGRSSGKSR